MRHDSFYPYFTTFPQSSQLINGWCRGVSPIPEPFVLKDYTCLGDALLFWIASQLGFDERAIPLISFLVFKNKNSIKRYLLKSLVPPHQSYIPFLLIKHTHMFFLSLSPKMLAHCVYYTLLKKKKYSAVVV